ncbi:transmembrane protein [Cystoisospora suis]|uniref:Transmembrane protein n=1 Tax=Cystoisospora suis TaxID=483139 RepID=A0A2C6KZD4_9APIC|nr:transmembrane protein [Cystoisospora suis]
MLSSRNLSGALEWRTPFSSEAQEAGRRDAASFPQGYTQESGPPAACFATSNPSVTDANGPISYSASHAGDMAFPAATQCFQPGQQRMPGRRLPSSCLDCFHLHHAAPPLYETGPSGYLPWQRFPGFGPRVPPAPATVTRQNTSPSALAFDPLDTAPGDGPAFSPVIWLPRLAHESEVALVHFVVYLVCAAGCVCVYYNLVVLEAYVLALFWAVVFSIPLRTGMNVLKRLILLSGQQSAAAVLAQASETSPSGQTQQHVSAAAALPPVTATSVFLHSPPRIASSASSELTAECHTGTPPAEGTGGFVHPRVYRHRSTSESIATRIASRLLPSVAPTAAAAESLLAQENLVIAEKLDKVTDSLQEAIEEGRDNDLPSAVAAAEEVPPLPLAARSPGNVEHISAPLDGAGSTVRQQGVLRDTCRPVSDSIGASPRQKSGSLLQVRSLSRGCSPRSVSLSPPSRVVASDSSRGPQSSPGKSSLSFQQPPTGDEVSSSTLTRAAAMAVGLASNSGAQGTCPPEATSPAKHTQSPCLVPGESSLCLPTPSVSPVSPRSVKTAPPIVCSPAAEESAGPSGEGFSGTNGRQLSQGSPNELEVAGGVVMGEKTPGEGLLSASTNQGNGVVAGECLQMQTQRVRSGVTSASAAAPCAWSCREQVFSEGSRAKDSTPGESPPLLAASEADPVPSQEGGSHERRAESAQFCPGVDSRGFGVSTLTHNSDRGRRGPVSHRRNLDLHRRLRSFGSSLAAYGSSLNTSFGQYTALRCEGRAACKRARSSRGKDESSGGADAFSPSGKQKHRKLSSMPSVTREPSWSLLGDVVLSSALVRLPARFLLFMIAPLQSLASPRPGKASARHASRPWFALLYRGCVLLLVYRAVSSYSRYSVSTVLLGAAGLGLLSITIRFILILVGKEQAFNRYLSWLSLPSLLTPVRRLLSLFHGSMQTSLNPILAIVVMLTSMLIFSLIVAFFCFQFYNEITLLWDACQRYVDTYILRSSTLQQAFQAIHTFVSPSDGTGGADGEEPSSSLYNTTIPSSSSSPPLSASQILFNIISRAAQAASGGGVANFGDALFGDRSDDSSSTLENTGPSSAARSPFSSPGLAHAFGGLGASLAATSGGGRGNGSSTGVGTSPAVKGGSSGNEGGAPTSSNSALKHLLGGSIGRYSDLWLSIRHLANAGSLQNGAGSSTTGPDKKPIYERRTGGRGQEDDATTMDSGGRGVDAGESQEKKRRNDVNQGWWGKREVNGRRQDAEEVEESLAEVRGRELSGGRRKCRKRSVRLTNKEGDRRATGGSSSSGNDSLKEGGGSFVGWSFSWPFKWKKSSESGTSPPSQPFSSPRESLTGTRGEDAEKEARETGRGSTTRSNTHRGRIPSSCFPREVPFFSLFAENGLDGSEGSCVRSKERDDSLSFEQDNLGDFDVDVGDEKQADAFLCSDAGDDFSERGNPLRPASEGHFVDGCCRDTIERTYDDQISGQEERYPATIAGFVSRGVGGEVDLNLAQATLGMGKTEGVLGGEDASSVSTRKTLDDSNAVGFWTGGDRLGDEGPGNQRLTDDVWKRWENTAELIGQLRKGNLSGAAGKVKEAWSEIYSLTSEGWWSYVTTYANTFFSGLLNSGFGAFRVFFFVFFLVFKFLLSAFDMLLQAVVFFSALYYLLCSSRSCLEYLEELLCIVDPSCIISHSINRGLRAILYSSVKRVWFYSLFTWFVYETAGMPVVYVPTAVSGLLALLPLLPPETISVIPCLVLWWGGGGADDAAAVATLALAHSKISGEFEQLPFQRPLSRAEAEAEALATGSWWGILSVTAGSQRKLGALALLAANAAVWWNVTTAIYREIPDSNPWLVGLSVALGLSTFGMKGIIIGPVLATLPLIVLTAAAKFSERRTREHQLAATVAQKTAHPVCTSAPSSPLVSTPSFSAAYSKSQGYDRAEPQWQRGEDLLPDRRQPGDMIMFGSGFKTQNERFKSAEKQNNLCGKPHCSLPSVAEGRTFDGEVRAKHPEESDLRSKSFQKKSDKCSNSLDKKGATAVLSATPDVSEVISGPPATPSAAAAAAELAKAATQAAVTQVASIVGEAAGQEKEGVSCGSTPAMRPICVAPPIEVVPRSVVPFQVGLRSDKHDDIDGTMICLHRPDPILHVERCSAFYGEANSPVDYSPWNQPFTRGAPQPCRSVTASSHVAELPPADAYRAQSVFGSLVRGSQGTSFANSQGSTALMFPEAKEGAFTSFTSNEPSSEGERVGEKSCSEDSRRSSISSRISSGTNSRDEGWWPLPDGDQVPGAAPLPREDSRLSTGPAEGRRGRVLAFSRKVADGAYTGTESNGGSSSRALLRGSGGRRGLLESSHLSRLRLPQQWAKRDRAVASGTAARGALPVVSIPGSSGRRVSSRASRVRCASYHGRENTFPGEGSEFPVWPPRSEESFLRDAASGEAAFLYPAVGISQVASGGPPLGVHASSTATASPQGTAPMLPPLFRRMLAASSSWGRDEPHRSVRDLLERESGTGAVGANRSHLGNAERAGSASGDDAEPGVDDSDDGTKRTDASSGAGERSRSSMLAAAVLKTAEKLEWLLERPSGGLVNSITTGSAPANLSNASPRVEDTQTKKESKKVNTVRTIAKPRRHKQRAEPRGLGGARCSKPRISECGGRRSTTSGAQVLPKNGNEDEGPPSTALVEGATDSETVEGVTASRGVRQTQLNRGVMPQNEASDAPAALFSPGGPKSSLLDGRSQEDTRK